MSICILSLIHCLSFAERLGQEEGNVDDMPDLEHSEEIGPYRQVTHIIQIAEVIKSDPTTKGSDA